MSEDQGSKTEEATDKRREEAFKEGNFAKTPDLGIVFVLISALSVMIFYGKDAASQVGIFTKDLFQKIGHIELNPSSAVDFLSSTFTQMFSILFPLFVMCCIGALTAGALQSGLKLTPDVLKLKFNKLDPVKGFKNLFSNTALVRAGGDILKFSSVFVIIWAAVQEIVNHEIFGAPVAIGYLAEFISSSFSMLLFRLVVVLGLIALLNYAYQRHKVSKDLRMTKQEVKDERKQQDGDPHVKAAMRSMARRLMQKQMIEEVPFADVVVTNPQHFAVALKYEVGKDLAPMVLAKGDNMLAKRIKEIAKEHKVPVVENKPVARFLFRVGKVGESIPPNLYQVIAQILSTVYRNNKYYFHRLKSRRIEREKAQAQA